jgi:hypothetical protein
MFIVCRSRVHLYRLRVINAGSKGHMNRIEVRRESVRRDLKFPTCGLIQLFDKMLCVLSGSPSEMPSQH